jgi:hypothetical protein
MFFNLSIFILYFFIVLFSTLGYGIFINRYFKIYISDVSTGIIGISGIIFLTLISYLSNIFFSHNVYHNSILVLLGLFFFFYYFLKNKTFLKKEIIKILSLSFLLIVALLISKNNEDFGYYHFAYIVNLIENKIQFGLANFNSGFGTHSSIFYFQSLLYLPFINYYLFNSHGLLILIFSNIFFLDNFFFKNKYNDNFIKFLSFFSFAIINITFSRLAEYGTDRAGQILVFILIIIFLTNLVNKGSLSKNNFKIIILLTNYIISIKSYFIVYAVLIPLSLLLKYKYYKNFLIKNTNLLFFSFLFLFMYFATNVANTGCIIFPLNFTCYSNLFWSVPEDLVIKLNHWFELWSKAGAAPNFIVQNEIEYTKHFNWISNWFYKYFLNKVTDYLAVIIFLIFLFFYLFRSFKVNKINILPSLIFFYIYLIILFIIWLNKHPDLRYGGYVLISLLFFIPVSLYLSKYKVICDYSNTKVLLIVCIIFLSFNFRNCLRIFNEFNRNDPYKFHNFPFYSKEYLKTNINFYSMQKPKKIFGYNFFKNKNN